LPRPGINSEANSPSPLKRAAMIFRYNPFQRVFAISLEI
jgi:hypothetical protein